MGGKLIPFHFRVGGKLILNQVFALLSEISVVLSVDIE